MTAHANRSGGAFSDINVTPLADVMIVLLIICMVVTPMMNDVLRACRQAGAERIALMATREIGP